MKSRRLLGWGTGVTVAAMALTTTPVAAHGTPTGALVFSGRADPYDMTVMMDEFVGVSNVTVFLSDHVGTERLAGDVTLKMTGKGPIGAAAPGGKGSRWALWIVAPVVLALIGAAWAVEHRRRRGKRPSGTLAE